MQSSVWKVTRPVWEQVAQSVKHAVVYMDNKMAELLHWSGGINILVTAGALDVREFSSFESDDGSLQKGVFMVSSALEGVTEDIIRDVVSQSHFQYVIVMTTVSPLLHDSLANTEDSDHDFAPFEDRLLEWMGNMNYTAQVEHVPLFCAELCPGAFLAPAFSSIFPLLDSDVKQISYQYTASLQAKDSKDLKSLDGLECNHLPRHLRAQIKRLGSGLHALLQLLEVREDVYSLGHTARLLASELESYPPARLRRKSCQKRASMVIVDRSLDLSAPTGHQSDSLMDRLVNTLQALPGHTSDHQVDMRALCHLIQGASSEHCVLPGSLAPSDCTQPPSHLTPLILKRQKEALMGVNRGLVEAAAEEKLPLDLSSRPGRVTADQLEATLALFKGNYKLIAKHLDLLQVAMATSQTLKHPSGALWDSLVAKEKTVVQALGEDADVMPSGLSLLAKAIMEERSKDKGERSLCLDDVLCLLAYLFSVSDGDCGEEEEASTLRDQLVEWIVADRDDLPPLTRQIVGDTVTESILSDQIESVWDKLTAVGEARASLQQFRSVLEPGDALSPAQVKPLLRQVLEAIVDPAKPDLPDIECKTGGLKDLLKSGFGFFKGSGKPRPGDAPLLILYVIGGVTANEIKQIKEVVEKSKPGFEVLIGSSHLSSVEKCLKSLLVDDNINIDDF